MSHFLSIFGGAALVILIYVSLIWILSVRLKNASIVDIFWGVGFVLANAYYFIQADGYQPRQILITLLVTVWGLRLSLYILWRNWGKGEDFRYQKFRAQAGDSYWWRSYFTVFLLQGGLLWLISAPLLAANVSPQVGLGVIEYLGVFVWGVGIFFETVGDWQLARFKANPAHKGQVFDQGLWRYTRHPNYFGDALVWWGHFLVAAASGGFFTLFSPLIMTTLLMRVSGVALLERTLQESKPGYRQYIARTNAFFPWFPKK